MNDTYFYIECFDSRQTSLFKTNIRITLKLMKDGRYCFELPKNTIVDLNQLYIDIYLKFPNINVYFTIKA